MIDDPSEDRGGIAGGLAWVAAGSLVLAVHAGVIVALAHRPDAAATATGGAPAMDVELEPVEGEKAPDATSAETSGDPATTAADAAAAAAPSETAAEPVAAPPPPERPRADPVTPPSPEPPTVEPAPTPPPEPPRVERVAPEPKPPATHASAASAAVAASEGSAPVVQKLSAGRDAAWRGLLVAHLNRFRRFPRGLRSGTARIGFTIDATGRVTATDVVAGSGDAALDAAARALVEQASPFPPPPAGVPGQGLSFVVPIHFDGRRP